MVSVNPLTMLLNFLCSQKHAFFSNVRLFPSDFVTLFFFFPPTLLPFLTNTCLSLFCPLHLHLQTWLPLLNPASGPAWTPKLLAS